MAGTRTGWLHLDSAIAGEGNKQQRNRSAEFSHPSCGWLFSFSASRPGRDPAVVAPFRIDVVFLALVIPDSVSEARAFFSARVGVRDPLFLFEIYRISEVGLLPEFPREI
jgi:hypothetical protein